MKRLILLLIIPFILSCSNKKSENQFQRFIDVDISADYKNYFDNLSSEYKDALKLEYNTSNLKIVYDSIVNDRKDIHDSIIAKKFTIRNYVVDSFSTTNKNIRIIKYRISMYDTKHKSELFKERIALENSINGEKKYTPYNPKSLRKLDSILTNKISSKILNEIQESLKFKEYENSDINFQKTKKRFKEYIANFKTNDLKLLDFIYPPVFETFIASNNQKEFTQEQKFELVEYIKKGRESQKLNFKRFLIDSFKKIDCSNEINAYILDYAIDVERNLYIPGKIIVIMENEKIYFVEFDLEELKTNFSNVFDEKFINCLENSDKE